MDVPVLVRAARRRLLDALHLSAFARDRWNHLTYLLSPGVRSRNARLQRRGAPDGLPLPTAEMVYLVTGQYEIEPFLDNGALGAACIREILARNGRRLEDCEAILDFGCGCGRVLRHWHALRGPTLCGSDSNPLLVRWCAEAFPFARFVHNRARAPLPYADATFDFIYAISVFTHFTPALQAFWVRELSRLLRPGGFLYLTACGASHASRLAPRERQRFAAGETVVLGGEFAGDNVCMAYHSETAMRRLVRDHFVVVDFLPLGARDARQDAYLLRREDERR